MNMITIITITTTALTTESTMAQRTDPAPADLLVTDPDPVDLLVTDHTADPHQKKTPISLVLLGSEPPGICVSTKTLRPYLSLVNLLFLIYTR
jgi:hypothetical protein